jgi:hypothetical protein
MTKRLLDQEFHRNEYVFYVVDADPIKITIDDEILKESQVLYNIEKHLFYLPVKAVVIRHVFAKETMSEQDRIETEGQVRFVKEFFKIGIQ